MGEEVISGRAGGHRNRLCAAHAVTEPMHRAGRKVHQSARLSDHVFAADAECDVSPHHVEGLIPWMAVRWRSASFRACLAEDLVTTSSGAWRENRDLLADNIKRGGPGRGCDNECFGHGNPLYFVFDSAQTDRASRRKGPP